MTNPDNVGWLPAKWREDADRCGDETSSERVAASTLRSCAATLEAELCRAASAGGDSLRALVKELRESLEGVVRVADRNTDEFDRAREAIARASHVFVNAGDSEAQFIADGENLDCPACGGSGHAGDSAPAGGDAVRDALAGQTIYLMGREHISDERKPMAELVYGMTVPGTGVLFCMKDTEAAIPKDSAPAGSGEVLDSWQKWPIINRLQMQANDCEDAADEQSDAIITALQLKAMAADLREAAALLRKLQQGAE